MTEKQLIGKLLGGGRVAVVSFKSSSDKLIEGKKGKGTMVLRLIESEFGDGLSPTVNYWLPRHISSLEQATAVMPCKWVKGQRLVVEWSMMERDAYALNGIRLTANKTADASSVSALEP